MTFVSKSSHQSEHHTPGAAMAQVGGDYTAMRHRDNEFADRPAYPARTVSSGALASARGSASVSSLYNSASNNYSSTTPRPGEYMPSPSSSYALVGRPYDTNVPPPQVHGRTSSAAAAREQQQRNAAWRHAR